MRPDHRLLITAFVCLFAFALVPSFGLEILSPSKLPDAVKGEFYMYELEASGAVGEVTWDIETGEMEYVEVETPHHFAEPSDAMQILQPADRVARVNLLFGFPFYGTRYRKMRIQRMGCFTPSGIPGGGSITWLKSTTVMGPFWHESDDWPFDSAYVQAVPWRTVFTWRGRTSGSKTYDINFQGIIYPSGLIEFNYGEGNQNLLGIIGISAGREEHYLVSVKDGSTDLDRAPSSRFMLSALPPELELHRGAGIISGTPEEYGLYAFRVRATDEGSEDPPVTQVFAIAVPGLAIHTRPGGVFIRKGEANPISWGGAGIGDRVTVKLYRGGELLETVLDDAPNEDGVMWQPADEYSLSDDYTIVVEDNNDPPFTDSQPLTIWDEYVLVPQCCPTVQEGVDFAYEGDTVLIAPGTYVENVLVNDKGITLEGAGGGEAVLDAGMSGSPLKVINADDVTIRDLTIAYAAGDALGGVYCADSTVVIERCRIHGSSATFGGGIFLDQSEASISECEISGNTAEQAGGGLYAWASKVILRDCVVKENTAKDGGGIFLWYSVPQIVRTVVAKNEAERGAGVFCDESAPVIVNCTITDNVATDGAGGIHCQRPAPIPSSPVIMNSVVWGNGEPVSGSSRMRVSYCDIDDTLLAGTSGNISADPLFVNADEADYQLADGSPCIDAGNPDPAYNDPDGSRCDMGAFGGAGYVPKHSWITHLIPESDLTLHIYWLSTALTDAVGQFTEDLLSGWSKGVSLEPEQKWTHTLPEPARWKFFRVRPTE